MNAENYNPAATEDDGSCTYPPTPVMGCTDEGANNYNAQATQDDGSCTYDVPEENNTTNQTDTGNTTTNQTNGSTGDGSTNETSNGTIDGTTNETTNESTTQTCDLCCGETYEHPADEPCPIAMCEPCEDDDATASTSSADTVRNVLVGVVFLLVLMLALAGRNPPKDGFEAANEDETAQENRS